MKATVPASDTKEQILNTAERLFAEHGFAGTSLRSIIREAGVNLAAAHYHFGSKEELFGAVAERIAKPVVEMQLQQLANVEAQQEPLSVEKIFEAFFAPPLQIIPQWGEQGIIHARFLGRCRTEPAPIRQLGEQQFHDSQQRFLDVLQRALPNQTRLALQWKFDLAIAVLIRVLNEAGQPNALLQGNSREDVETAVERLVKFIAPGMQA